MIWLVDVDEPDVDSAITDRRAACVVALADADEDAVATCELALGIVGPPYGLTDAAAVDDP